MLAYLDRLPLDLPLGPRLGLMSVRLWARRMKEGLCPLGVLRPLYDRFEARGALWPAHNFLYWLTAHVARPIDLGCPCCGRVSEDEALILAAMFAEDDAPARAALTPLVSAAALGGAVRLARSFGVEIAHAAALRGSAASE